MSYETASHFPKNLLICIYDAILKGGLSFLGNKLEALYGKITYTRTVLHALLNYNSPTDYKVLNCSRHLDMLLNKYEKVKIEILNSNHKEAI